MRVFLVPVVAALFTIALAAHAHAQEPTATPTIAPRSTAELQGTPPSTVVPPPEEAPPEPTNVRLFLLGTYARLEWEFTARPSEPQAQGFTLRVLTNGEPGPVFVVGGDVRAFDFPPEFLPRCGGPQLMFGVSAFVEAGTSDWVDDAIVFSSDCHPTIEDPAPPVGAGAGDALQPPDAGDGMRDEDWTAVTSSHQSRSLACYASLSG